MSKKKKEIEEIVPEDIIFSPIEDVLSQGFGRYSKYVLQERAVPDVRDGLKPVQRRIIYTMTIDGNVYAKPTRKCARTVGAVIGRFHPHGDTSVYEALVRLSQDWKMRYPLIDFQGNKGSIDGDGPAQYRYTEARLSELSELLVQDLNKDVVDMELNFDDQEYEPSVLPSRFPNLLVNGATGIAIGASTDIPPHNLGEVIDAINYRISHKNAKVDDILGFIKGPDFPTGGVIKDASGLKDLYRTGSGSFKVYARAEIVAQKDYNQIIITEIPYNKDKSEFVKNIDKIRFQEKLTSILEVRDETGMDGLRIAIDLNKDADPKNILNFLYKSNALSNTIKFNLLVIDNYHPRVLNILEIIDCYIAHQIDVITRRSNYDLKKARARLHIVSGLIRAVSILDDVVKTIRQSEDKADARKNLINKFSFSTEQAEAILNLQLYRLTNLDIVSLQKEKEELDNTISYLEELLDSPTKMHNLIKSDLNKIKDKFSDERKTTIEDSMTSFEVDKNALITKEEVMLAFTRDGYIKKSSMKFYKTVNGQLPELKQGDVYRGVSHAFTTDQVMLITSLGNFILTHVNDIPEVKWKDEAPHINDFGHINPNEKIIKAFVVSCFKEGVTIGLISKLGQVKRVSLTEFDVQKKNKPIKCFNLISQDDELVDAVYLRGNDDVLILTDNGYSSLFNENGINLVGIRAGGIKALSTQKDKKTNIVSMMAVRDDERFKVVILTERKGLKVIDSSHFEKSTRLGAKQQVFKAFKSDKQEAIYYSKVDRKESGVKINAVLENLQYVQIELEDVKPQPFDAYLKSNLNIKTPFGFIDCDKFDVDYLDDSIKVTQVETIKKQPTIKVEEKEDDYEQLSLFDFVDDD